MPGETSTDARRDAGERTRQRLLDAARGLLAEHGENAVTLRDITTAAEANVAAVSYHFGSKDALCRQAMEHAISRVLAEQVARMRRLDQDATVREIARAWAGPVIAALSRQPCEQHALLRVMARTAGDPPPELRDWMAAQRARAEPDLLAPLRRALPGVPDDDLRLRLDCAAGILYFATTGNMCVDLADKSEDELERLLVPVIAGALAAS